MMNTKKLVAAAAAAAVLTLGAGGTAIAAQQGALPGQEDQEKDPAINGSVAAPPETEANDATETPESEAAEAEQLKSLAKIDQAAAEKAALDAVPGEVKETELDNENGFVVYSVEVMGQDGKLQEVVVDAGDGTVLAQEAEEDEGSEANEGPEHEANEGPEAGEATR
jgi:uncharacterized membrane protein YkoI